MENVEELFDEIEAIIVLLGYHYKRYDLVLFKSIYIEKDAIEPTDNIYIVYLSGDDILLLRMPYHNLRVETKDKQLLKNTLSELI